MSMTDKSIAQEIVSLNDQYILKDANPSFLSYSQDQVTAGLRYPF